MTTKNTDQIVASDSHQTLWRLLALRGLVLLSLFGYALVFSPNAHGIQTVATLFMFTALFTSFIWLKYRNGQKLLTNPVLIMQLLWDTLVILIFVYVNGRSTNPFIYYLLVIIAISASLFPERIVWFFCASGICAYSLFMYMDTDAHFAHMNHAFKLHLIGMWINFVGSAVLISFFISRLTITLQSRERALALAREEILKNEQLIGIGTLAASTVHSFGTPLSTITFATQEIASLHNDRSTTDLTAIISTQIDRCKSTMAKLTSLASHKASPNQEMPINEFLQELREHFILMNANPMPAFSVDQVNSRNDLLPSGILLLHAVINLIDNAIRAAKTSVDVSVDVIGQTLSICIEDDGSGLAPAQLDNLGNAIAESKTGLGIGFLLANSTIDRLGGSVRFSNPVASNSNPKTTVNIYIPFCKEPNNAG